MRSKTIHGGKRLAQSELAKMVAEVSNGNTSVGTETVGDLLDQFLAHVESLGRSPTTIYEYRRIAEKVLRPEFGRLKLARLTARDLDRGSPRRGIVQPRCDAYTLSSASRCTRPSVGNSSTTTFRARPLGRRCTRSRSTRHIPTRCDALSRRPRRSNRPSQPCSSLRRSRAPDAASCARCAGLTSTGTTGRSASPEACTRSAASGREIDQDARRSENRTRRSWARGLPSPPGFGRRARQRVGRDRRAKRFHFLALASRS